MSFARAHCINRRVPGVRSNAVLALESMVILLSGLCPALAQYLCQFTPKGLLRLVPSENPATGQFGRVISATG